MTKPMNVPFPDRPVGTPQLQPRQLLVLGAAALLGACAPPEPPGGQTPLMPTRMAGSLARDPEVIQASMQDERFPLEGADLREVHEQFLRTMVPAPSGFAPGTMVISTSDRFLYLIESGGRAIRYGVGVRRQGASWRGRARLGAAAPALAARPHGRAGLRQTRRGSR